jgi:hypothetical protein
MSVIRCRLAELELLASAELLAEQDRLKNALGARLVGIGPPQPGAHAARLTRLMHDYLDVQHILRHRDVVQ